MFFIVLLGAKSKVKLLSETKYAFKESFKPIKITLIGLNVILVVLHELELMTLNEIVNINGITILIYGSFLILMFLYLKAIPFVGYHGITIVYRNLIKQCYLHHANPLSNFFTYFATLLYLIHGIQWLIMVFVLA